MAGGLSRFQRWVVAWQRRQGTAHVVATATVFSCVVSCAISYGSIVAMYGWANLLAGAEPLLLILPLVVPAVVTPIGTLQLATLLSTAAGVIDELSAAQTALECEVAARKATQLELEHLARRDPLTGLLNRRGFFGALDEMSQEQLSTLVLATVDVDRFKSVNDTLGHAVGDSVLQAVGDRLSQAAGDDAIVARLGGDEFVAAVFCGASGNQIRRDLDVLDLTDDVSSSLQVFCSVGVAAHSAQTSIDDTLARADAALYREKAHRQREAVTAQQVLLASSATAG